MDESPESFIKKHSVKHKEAVEYLSQVGETSFSYSPEDVKKLVDDGKIPKELGSWYFNNLEKQLKKDMERVELFKSNQDLPLEERIDNIPKEEEEKFYEDVYFSTQLYMHLLQNQHLLTNTSLCPATATQHLFDNVNIAKEFGMSNCISNALFHLEELLKGMKADKLGYDNLYDAKNSIKNASGEAISLNYSFQAPSQEDADIILKDYKSTMVSRGLRVLLSYWAMANRQGRVEYSCPMTDIMKMMADENRETFFSVKEKEEHWALTKMLGGSKLSRERKVKKRGTGAEVVQWVEQPLVEIVGGEKEMTAEDKYPTVVAVRVLMPRMDTKGFSPSIFMKNTLRLSPSDVFLAFKLQTRATQMQRGSKELHFNWDFVIEAGGLQTTAISNHSVAKASARKKMDRLQKGEIIEGWDEELLGICVTPKKTKGKRKKDVKKNTET